MRLLRGPLRSRNFQLLLACDVVSMAGTAIALIAIPFAVLSIGGSGSDVGFVATAALLAVPLIAAAAFVAGVSSELFGINWVTTMQQEIPLGALSRVSAYDALGSFALAPVGTAIAGPLLGAFGASAVLAVGGALVVIFTAAVFLVPEVRQLRRAPLPATVSPQLP
jgi:hypothetical protein